MLFHAIFLCENFVRINRENISQDTQKRVGVIPKKALNIYVFCKDAHNDEKPF